MLKWKKWKKKERRKLKVANNIVAKGIKGKI